MKLNLKRFGRRMGKLAGVFCCVGSVACASTLCAQQSSGSHGDLQAMQLEFPAQPIRTVTQLPAVDEPQSGESNLSYQGGTVSFVEPGNIANLHRLNHVGWQQFEQKLVELWGDQLQAVAENEEGSVVRVFIPGTDSASNQMVIDRLQNLLVFEGDDANTENWNALIDLLDSSDDQNDGSVRLVGMGNATAATVRRAVAFLGIPEDPSRSLSETLRTAASQNSARIASPHGAGTQQLQRRTPLKTIPFQPSNTGSTTPARPVSGTTHSGMLQRRSPNAWQNPAQGSSASIQPPRQPLVPQATPASQPGRRTQPVTNMPTRLDPYTSGSGSPSNASSGSTHMTGFARQQQDEGPPTQILELDDATLQGTVQIKVLDDLGTIVLIGNPEDVAKVRAMIEKIVSTADVAQPAIEMYELRNIDSDRLKEIIDEVYVATYESNNGAVSITAIDSPNSLLVTGQPAAQGIILELIKKLDVVTPETDQTIDFRVFQLQHMSAADAAQRLRGYFRQSTQSSDTINPENWIAAIEGPVSIVLDYRSNSIIVKGNQRVLATTESLIQAIDVDEGGAKHVVRFFPVRNALAVDVAVVLQAAINGQLEGAPQAFTTGGNQQFQQNQGQTGFGAQAALARLPVTMLELTAVDGEGGPTRSGILFDVKVTADNNSNQLMVTGPGNSMDLIGELIRQLDRIPDAETQIKVFTVYNGDATELLATLQSIFGVAQAGGQQGNQAGSNLSNLPLQSSSGTVGSTLINLRFGVDTRTNSIIASGPIGDLQVVDDLLNRLDEEDLSNRINRILRLRNAPAEDVAIAINDWLDGRQAVFDADPTSSNPYEAARRQVVVVPELVSNSLIISATPAYYQELIRLIEDLDRRPPMVKIKVLIAEVNLNKLSEFGMQVGIQDSLLFDRGVGVVGFPFNQAGIGNNTDALALGTRELLAGQALSNLGLGRSNADLGYGGLVLSAGNESISVLLRALENRNVVRILSTPDITTLDNLQGRIQVGAQVPRVTGAAQNDSGGITTNVADESIGIILAVTPRVSPDGMIIMNVDAVNSSLGSEADGVPVFVSEGTVVRSPQINIIQAQTTVMARTGQTVAFSGLIQESVSEAKRGTPILSDLPVIGPMFSFESDSHSRNELLIVLTPYLIDSDEQLEASNRTAMDRMNWCAADVANVYGPVGYGEFDPENVSGMVPATYYPDEDPLGENPEYLPLENKRPLAKPAEEAIKGPLSRNSVPDRAFNQATVQNQLTVDSTWNTAARPVQQTAQPPVFQQPVSIGGGASFKPVYTPPVNSVPHNNTPVIPQATVQPATMPGNNPQAAARPLMPRAAGESVINATRVPTSDSWQHSSSGDVMPVSSTQQQSGAHRLPLAAESLGRLQPVQDFNTARLPQVKISDQPPEKKATDKGYRIKNPFFR